MGGRVISNPTKLVADFCYYKRQSGHEFHQKSDDFPKNRNIVFRNEGKGERVSQSFSENSSKFGNTGVPNFIYGSLVTRVHAPEFCSFGSKLDNQ